MKSVSAARRWWLFSQGWEGAVTNGDECTDLDLRIEAACTSVVLSPEANRMCENVSLREPAHFGRAVVCGAR